MSEERSPGRPTTPATDATVRPNTDKPVIVRRHRVLVPAQRGHGVSRLVVVHPADWRSIRRSTPTISRSASRRAICSVGLSSSLPGNTRARFVPSPGLLRMRADQAGGCAGAAIPTSPRSRSPSSARRSTFRGDHPLVLVAVDPAEDPHDRSGSRRGDHIDSGERRRHRNVGYRAATAWERCAPSPEIPRSRRSPGTRYLGGCRPNPTPAGVPVLMMSPGSRTMNLLRYQTR
jgi:hypothetical protein